MRRQGVRSPLLEEVRAVDAPQGFPGIFRSAASNNAAARLPGGGEGVIWGETWCDDLQPSQKSEEAAEITWPRGSAFKVDLGDPRSPQRPWARWCHHRRSRWRTSPVGITPAAPCFRDWAPKKPLRFGEVLLLLLLGRVVPRVVARWDFAPEVVPAGVGRTKSRDLKGRSQVRAGSAWSRFSCLRSCRGQLGRDA